MRSFDDDGETLAPGRDGQGHLAAYRSILDRYLRFRTGNILEWGAGYTTREMVHVLDRRGCRLFLTIDADAADLRAAVAGLEHASYLRAVLQRRVGSPRGRNDPATHTASYPLALGRTFDFIFIRGRRRLGCAYTAALLSHADTVVVMQDYSRARQQRALGLFDVVEASPGFRVMRVKPAILASLEGGLGQIADKRRRL